MDSASDYSGLLEVLYAATLDEAQWQVFLERLCAITGSIAVRFIRNDSVSGVRMLTMGGAVVLEQVDEAFHSSYRYTDPLRQAYMQSPRVGFIEGESLIPHEELVKTETFQAVAVPYGLMYVSLLMISISPSRQELISMWRGAGRQFLEQEHIDLLEMLLPHLQNVLKIRRVLGLAEERARNAEAMLNASAIASILLDGNGCLIYMNDAAQSLAAASNGICVWNHRIMPVDPSRRSEFAALVTASASMDSGDATGALMLPRNGHKRALHALVTPLRLADPHRASVRTLVLVTDPDVQVNFPDTVLRQWYGMTPAETEVANGLLTGCSVEEIASLRRVSTATVRSQVRSLLAKTNTQRLADLVRLLAALPRVTPPTTAREASLQVDQHLSRPL